MADVQSFGIQRFSTRLLPDGERIGLWREAFGRALLQLDLQPAEGAPFCSEGAMQALPGMSFGAIVTSACRAERTRQLVRDGRDDIGFVAVVEGSAVVLQGGREAQLDAGEAIFLSNSEAGLVDFREPTRYINFAIPRRTLAPLVNDVDGAWMRVVDRGDGALRMATRYATFLLVEAESEMPAETYHAVASHFCDLVAAMIGKPRRGGEARAAPGMWAARMSALKADIANSLDRQDLSVAGMAARHGITPRYVAKLFEREGTTFSRFVLEQRLARAYQKLADPRLAHHSISAIAIDAGFGDISHFNRSFRTRYGATPSDIRERVGRRDSG